MTAHATQLESAQLGPLVERCAQLRIPVVLTDVEGRVHEQYVPEGSWLDRMVIDSPVFSRALEQAAAQWDPQAAVEPRRIWPGCWALPLPLLQHRRAIGYRVCLFFTNELAHSEQFMRVLDGAEQDRKLIVGRMTRLKLMGSEEVHRFAELLRWMDDDLEQQQQHDDEIDVLSQQLAETYEELSLVYKLSTGMTVSRDPEQFAAEALSESQQVVGLRWMALQLTDDDPRLQAMRGRTVVAGEPPCDQKHLTEVATQLLHHCREHELPTIIQEPHKLGLSALRGWTSPLLVVPCQREDRPLGVLVGGEKHGEVEMSSVDAKLVTSLGQSIGIFVENAMLYEDAQDMFMGTLRSLVNAIDAKDTYTCGHSERVAWLGQELARAAGLDEHTIERVYLAGLLHDVGKIGVPEYVLTKPGGLTDEEFDIIKAHPAIGARIVRDIRQMQDLIPGVLYHHERFDGRGYPEGLSGYEIPLFGRLLCLADSFDAMSSNRTYRSALPLAEVLEEIRNCAGAQFDPELAQVFVNLDFNKYHQMIQEHQHRESLLRQELGGRE